MGDWPLRGRDPVLVRLREVLARRRSVVIAGPAGVGKTRLARELASEHHPTGWVAASTALQPISFGAVAHLLEAGDWLPPDDLLAALRSAAGAVTRSGAELVVVDDIHLLDDRSLALVHHLLRSRVVPVVATVRDRSDATGQVQGLWKDGLAELVDLEPLGVDHVAELVDDVLDGEVEEDVAGDLHRLTGGNPLLLRETVRSAVADGALSLAGGRWRWSGLRLPSPDLVGAVRSRLTPLGSDAVMAGDLLAIGEPLPVAVVREVAGEAAVDALEQAGLARIDGTDDSVRFVHPIFGEVLAAALGASRRQVIHGRLARSMEGLAVSPTDQLRVARWRLGSGMEWTSEEWTSSAVLANSRFSHTLAAELARRARAAGGGFAAALALGTALVGLRRFAEADVLLSSVEADARGDDELVELAVTRYLARTSQPGFPASFAAELEGTENRVQDPDRRAFLQATRATHLCFGGELREGRDLVDRVLADLGDRDDEGASAVRVRLAIPYATINIHRGFTRRAADMSASLLAPALSLGDQVPGAPAWAAASWLSSLIVGGHLAAAAQVLEQFRGMVAAGDRSEEFREQATTFLDLCDGQIMSLRGDVPAAVSMLRTLVNSPGPSAAAHLGEQPPISAFPMATHFMVEAAAVAAEVELAEAAARVTERMLHWPLYQAVSDLTGAWVLAARGSVSQAADRALAVARAAEAEGALTMAVYAGHTAARLGLAGDVAEALGRLAGTVELAAAALYADHAVALATRDGAQLDAVAERFSQAEFQLLAAESAAAAGLAHARAGRPRAADRSTARAATLLAVCGGVRPAWLSSVEAPIPLTRREREVTNLAAQGMTSPAIAERLFVSTRTVEGHLLRAYQKLGVRNRQELARLLAGGDVGGDDSAPAVARGQVGPREAGA